jgi:hypothetical protein
MCGWWLVPAVATWFTACSGTRPPARQDTASTASQKATVTVTRLTVIAYFVIPPGAVDTLPDLAVEADDWNVSMATLADSLAANGIGFAMATDTTVRLRLGAGRDTTIALGPFKSSGYIFVQPSGPTCVRNGGADVDSVLAIARGVTRGGGCA